MVNLKTPQDLSASVYLLVGKEDFLKDEFISKLRATLFKNADAGLNWESFDAELSGFGPALEFLQTAPFLAEKRLAVLKNIDSLEEETKQSILRYVQTPSSTGVLVLDSDAANIKKDDFLKGLSEKTRFIPCYAPFDSELPGWVQSRVKIYGKTLNTQAQNLLLECVGKDTRSLDAALDQLSVYVDPRNEISAEDVKKLLGHSAQADAFGLLEALIARRAQGALRILSDLRREGARAPEIVGALSSQLEKLRQVKSLRMRGLGAEQIAAEMKLHPFFVRKTVEQADRVPAGTLDGLLQALLDCDESLKTGKLGERLALERFALGALGERVDR